MSRTGIVNHRNGSGEKHIRFKDEVGAEIVARHASGESLPSIAKDPNMPHRLTIQRWEQSGDHKAFASSLAGARKLNAECRAFEGDAHLYDLSDADLKDLGAAASPAVKIRESRSKYSQWLAGKLDPDTWGDKQQIDLRATVTTLSAFVDIKPREAEVLTGDDVKLLLPHVTAPDDVDGGE